MVLTGLNKAPLGGGIGEYASLISEILGKEHVISLILDKKSVNLEYPGVTHRGIYPPVTSGWYLTTRFPKWTLMLSGFKFPDFIHYLSPFLFPIKNVECIVTFHDLYYLHAIGFSMNNVNKLTKKYMGCNYLLSVTHSTKEEMVSIGFPADNITVIRPPPNGIFNANCKFEEDYLEIFRQNYHVTKPIVLTVGDGSNKNNFLINKAVKDKYFHIHVGKDVAADLNLNNVDSLMLKKLYCIADVFIRLSSYEGFGFPPIEATMSGTPTVVSNLPVFHETLGDSAIYSTLEIPGILESIKCAIDQKENLFKTFNDKYKNYYTFERFNHEMIDYYVKVSKEIGLDIGFNLGKL